MAETETTTEAPPVMGTTELAGRFAISRSQFQNWKEEPSFPAALSPGKWVVREVDAWVKLMRQVGGPAALRRAGGKAPSAAPDGTAPGMGHESEADAKLAQEASSATTPSGLLHLSDKALRKQKVAEEVIARRLANQERRRQLIERAAVEEFLFATASRAKTIAWKIELELPPKLIGLDRPELEERLRQEFDGLFQAISALGDPIPTDDAAQPEGDSDSGHTGERLDGGAAAERMAPAGEAQPVPLGGS